MAQYDQTVTPTAFGLTMSLSLLTMAVVGGLGSIPGAYIGAFFITLLPNLLGALPASIGTLHAHDSAPLVSAVLLLPGSTFMPGGIWSGVVRLRQWALRRRASRIAKPLRSRPSPQSVDRACRFEVLCAQTRRHRFEPGLEEPQFLRFVREPQATDALSALVYRDHRLRDHIHVCLCVHASWYCQSHELELRISWSPVLGSRPADTTPRSILRIPASRTAPPQGPEQGIAIVECEAGWIWRQERRHAHQWAARLECLRPSDSCPDTPLDPRARARDRRSRPSRECRAPEPPCRARTCLHTCEGPRRRPESARARRASSESRTARKPPMLTRLSFFEDTVAPSLRRQISSRISRTVRCATPARAVG